MFDLVFMIVCFLFVSAWVGVDFVRDARRQETEGAR
jgi:hypothetical protein